MDTSMKNAAEMYALGCIDLVDVEWALSMERDQLPKEFFEYADEYYKQYEAAMKAKYGE